VDKDQISVNTCLSSSLVFTEGFYKKKNLLLSQ